MMKWFKNKFVYTYNYSFLPSIRRLRRISQRIFLAIIYVSHLERLNTINWQLLSPSISIVMTMWSLNRVRVMSIVMACDLLIKLEMSIVMACDLLIKLETSHDIFLFSGSYFEPTLYRCICPVNKKCSRSANL